MLLFSFFISLRSVHLHTVRWFQLSEELNYFFPSVWRLASLLLSPWHSTSCDYQLLLLLLKRAAMSVMLQPPPKESSPSPLPSMFSHTLPQQLASDWATQTETKSQASINLVASFSSAAIDSNDAAHQAGSKLKKKRCASTRFLISHS